MWTREEENKIILESYDAYADRIYRYVFLRTGKKEVAEDIVQDIFLRMCDYIASGNVIDKAEHFLMRTARNAVIDYYRKKKSLSLDEIEEGGFIMPDDPDLSIYEEVEVKRVMRAMYDLPDKHRDVLLLKFVEGLGPQDIGELLNESSNVISVRLHRAQEELKKQLHI